MVRKSMAAFAALTMLIVTACGGSESGAGPGPNPNPGPKPVSSIEVTPPNATIATGASQQFTAATKDAAGNVLQGRTITWSSSAAAIATVDGSGKVTGVAAGSATIIATSEGKSATAEIAVTSVPVNAVVITPVSAGVKVGRTTQLAAAAQDAQGNTLAGRIINWTSLDTDIATVDNNGLVTGVTPGFADVMAASEGVTKIAQITVTAVSVSAVRIDSVGAGIPLGGSVTMKARTYDDTNVELTGRPVQWSSDKPAVISVDAATGVAQAVAPGSATITARSENATGTMKVDVTVPVASVQVVAALDTLEAYDTRQLQSFQKDALGNLLVGRTVRWASSDTSIAKVDSVTGVLTGIDRGTVTITATSEGVVGVAKRVVVILYRQITTGTMHACDIASGGIAWCWGLAGSEGRIGDGTIGNYTMSSTPVRVSGNHRFVQLSTFARHTCGITVDGSAYCWGTNSWGSLGTGTNISQSPTPVPVAGGLKFKQISVGADHSCGVTTANQAYCWGNGQWRQLGTGTSASSGTPVPVALNQSIAQVAAGVSFSCALTTTGAAYCWGANTIGEIGDGGKIAYGNVYVTLPQAVVGGHSFKSISLGQHYACAVTTTGQGYCWGSDGGKLGSGNIGDTSTPRAVTGGFTFQQLAAGFGHACGVSTNAEVYCWGGNGNGQLGVVALNGSTVPVRPNGNMTGAEVSAAGIGTGSGAHTCAIAKDRLTVNCWGRNDYGQLGNGQTGQPTDRNYNASIVVGQKPLPQTF